MKTLYIIISFCLGLLLGYVLFKSGLKPNSTEAFHLPSNTLSQLNQMDSARLASQYKFTFYKDSLSKKLNAQTFLIGSQKKRLIHFQQKINQLVFQLQTDSIQGDSLLTDSLGIAITDSQIQTDTLIASYERKCQLYDTLLAVRDSQILILNKSYGQLQDFAKEQALREQQLTNDLNTTLKALNRKRNQNRILAGGMLFISGVATTLFIKSRQ